MCLCFEGEGVDERGQQHLEAEKSSFNLQQLKLTPWAL